MVRVTGLRRRGTAPLTAAAFFVLAAVAWVFCLSDSSFSRTMTTTTTTTTLLPSVPQLRTAFFPLVLAPTPPERAATHVDLMEWNDGIYHEDKCRTWGHTDDAGPFKKFNCGLEWDEWMLANAFVQEGDVVLEFGARYGTTSCVLSRAVGATGHVVAIEVDESVHGYLMRNRHDHKCNYHAVLGTVSTEPLYLAKYAGYALEVSKENKRGNKAIPRTDVATIEGVLGRKVNVALIDCEGCIESVEENGLFDENNGVDLILMEEDSVSRVDYSAWHKKLVAYGFECIWYTKDSTFALHHSAWLHKTRGKGRFRQPCAEYVAEKEYSNKQIQCLDLPI